MSAEIIAGAVAAVLTSLGAGGALGSWVRGRAGARQARVEGEAQVGVALVVRDQILADRLLRRIGDLETRCDVLSDGIAASRREAEECREGRSECERRTAALEERVVEATGLVERMRDQLHRVEVRLTSTPPGAAGRGEG